MIESKRLSILQALTRHLEGIDAIDPYTHDLSGRVYRGRSVISGDTPLPALSLLEGKATDYGVFADENQMVRKDSWLLLLQGWVQDDPVNPTDPAYQLLADVELRLSDIIAVNEQGQPKYPGAYLLNGLITGLTVASPVVRPPEDGLSSKAFFYLPLLVGMASDLSKPKRGR